MDINKEREAFEAWHYEQYLLENPNIDISNAKYIYDYAHKNALVCQLKESHFLAWQAAKTQAVPDLGELQERIAGHQHYHDEHGHMIVDMDDVVKEISGFDSWKTQAVPEGFVLISAEQLSQWGHMANYAEQYGCLECFEARGYAHNLGCEINAYFNVSEAQEPAND